MRAGITFFVAGCLLILLAAVMVIPTVLDFADGQTAAGTAFGISALMTGFSGALLFLTFYNRYEKLSVREMYLTTSIVWVVACAFAALPFYFAPVPMDYTDAFFEAMSGLTTMGATIIRDYSQFSRGILLWRGILQWIGGLGIIVIALGVLPLLRIGGMQLFSMESSDKSGKKMPKTSQIIGTMMIIYIAITIACILCLALSGLTPFEAVAYSLATVSTGGFAPRASSAADLSFAAQWVLVFFMFISGLPLLLPYSVLKKDWKQIKADMQIKTYIVFTLAAALGLTVWLLATHPGMTVSRALTDMTFSIVTVLTSTGFAVCDLESFGVFAVMFFTFLMPVGACSGSTSGGIKLFRFNIIYLFSVQYLRHKLLPHGVFIAKYNGRPLTEEITSGVFVFLAIFLMSAMISMLVLAALGLDFVTVFTGVISALGNAGLAFGSVIGAQGSFANLPDAAKWILSADMVLGRLEYITVFVILLPLAWRKEPKKVQVIDF